MQKRDMKILAICLLATLSGGCAKLTHLQELLTLKAYSDEQEGQAEYVKEQDARFEKLLAAVNSGDIENYFTPEQIIKTFGDPVFRREAEREGQVLEVWLYRYAIRFFDSDKVYLYFDDENRLKDWEHVPAQPKEDEPGTKDI